MPTDVLTRRLYARTRTVHSVTVGATGHTHTAVEEVADGTKRLVVDCEQCLPYLHPQDFAPTLADVAPTYDELRAEAEAQERQKRIGPDIAEVVARVTSETMLARTAPAAAAAPAGELITVSRGQLEEIVAGMVARQRAEASA